ncbi:serine/threonine-protein kinase [Nonomuraea africana]|uniref:non-specific serine/threonine protein kinase n=1 Tax=Nonomuraea africana TaxID=46171 RepID=A0ABR9KF05_9ACTN|nr:serine/threonine-protein kinase [Nonomuraea africana]MBE1560601.1 serine/threonine protein kinase [Nonomuraea africana]
MLDRYRLLARVGRGGMGVVWRAHDSLLRRDVAIKVLVSGNDRAVLREARAAARLTHPSIVTVYDVAPSGDNLWIVMELVHESVTLSEMVSRLGPLPAPVVTRIARSLLSALSHAHDKGVLHRDVNPHNVLLASDRVVLIDFGIAAPVGRASSAVAGTPGYIAPERYGGGPHTAAADLWSLGATLYTAMESRPPCVAPDPTADPGPSGLLGRVVGGLLTDDPYSRLSARAALSALASAKDPV